MPPKTAMRLSSGITLSMGSIGADRTVLVTGVASMVPECVTAARFFQRCAQAGVGCFDQDRADVNPAIGHHAAVVTDKVVGIETLHHFRRDALFRAVASSP